jgi:thioredoxin reductase
LQYEARTRAIGTGEAARLASRVSSDYRRARFYDAAMAMARYDVIIVGGGPAGLSAALVLGRCRYRVLLCDEGRPRNEASSAVHNFFTREGTPPDELLRIGRVQLAPYDVEIRDVAVASARRERHGFVVRLADGQRARGRKLLLATGIRDNCPPIPRIREFVGRGVYYCSYCDAYTVRDRPLAALGHGRAGADLALALTTWSDTVTLCTNDGHRPRRDLSQILERYGVGFRTERIVRVEGNAALERIVFARGPALPCAGLFIQEGDRQQSDLASQLGCDFSRRGGVRARKGERTSVPSLFVAGDAADAVRAVVVAAASGAEAAFTINRELREERCAVE